jgi:FAD synthase
MPAIAPIESAGGAKRLRRSCVATFEPPPRRYFQPDAPPFRLMTPKRREIALLRWASRRPIS